MKIRRQLILMAGILLFTQYLYSQESSDSIKNYRLDEVVVNARRIIHKPGHDVLYLSKENENFGTNALDAVSSLVMFQTNINETTLMSWDRKEVFILINGVPSTATDLRAYKGTDIKNVEYYSVAPPEYMGFTEGPLANIIVKKRHDRAYTGYFNTSNSVTTGYGTNQVDLTYADSLNQVKLGYFIDYRNIGDMDIQSDFIYGTQLSSKYRGARRYKGEYHNISASYQRFQGNHLFNAKLYTAISPGKNTETRTGDITTDEVDYQGTGLNILKSNSRSVTLDLYYRYMLKQGRLFAINVVNTLGDSYSHSMQSMKSIDDLNNAYDYNVNSKVDNDSYSLVTTALFATPLWGGSFNMSAKYEYQQLNQLSLGSRYKPYSHEEFINSGGYWHWNGFSFSPVFGLDILKQVSTSGVQNNVTPYIRLYSDWWGKGKMEGITVQLTLKALKVAPSLNDITGSGTYIDPWFMAVGNPELKSYWITSGKLSFAYFPSNSKNSITFVATPSYSYNKTASTVVKSGDFVYLKPQNIGGSLDCKFYLHASWYPFKWLELSPYMEYLISQFNTPLQKVKLNYFRAGGSLVVSHKNLALTFHINSPIKQYDGDLLSRGSLQYSGVVQYKLGNWSLGAQYNYLGHNDYTVANLSDFRYYENKHLKELHHLFRLNATYTFSVGKVRRHDSKIINESSKGNTGLNKFNTAKFE